MYQIILIRHGQSTWNKKNLFNGWVDTNLSRRGKKEAKRAGKILKEKGFKFDLVFSSVLKRAIETTDILLRAMGLKNVAAIKSWRLNERHYGALQGKNKKETAEKYGEEQAHL